MTELFFTIFSLVVLMFSVIIHELAHGYAADALGDTTPRYYGRLTINPLAHIDLYGTIIFPAMMFFLTQGHMWFGWAKPVPVNPYKFSDQKWGELKVSLAGPMSNISLALFFGFIVRLSGNPETFYMANLLAMMQYVVIINLTLAVFNLIPIPPLDGSHVLGAFLPNYENAMRALPWTIQILALLALINIGGGFISAIVGFLFTLITGFVF